MLNELSGALRHLRSRAKATLQPSSPTTPNHGNDVRLHPNVANRIVAEHSRHSRNLGALTIAEEARRQGAVIRWLSKREAWAEIPDRRIPITGHMGSESALAASLVGDKALARNLMTEAKVPVPPGRTVRSESDAIRAQKELGTPVVIKPRFGSMGRGVTVDIERAIEVRKAYQRARLVGRSVLVEAYISGDEYRAHATPEMCHGIFRRLLPSVIGDGQRTIRDLIDAKNATRAHNPTTKANPIPIDQLTEDALARQNLDLDTVLKKKERITVRAVNGITSGGESEECYNSVDDAIKAIAARAVASIPGMHWGGVDIIVDHRTGTPFVMEINTDASINGSTFPVYGEPRNLGKILWHQMHRYSATEVTDTPFEHTSLLHVPRPVYENHTMRSSTVSLQDLLQRELASRAMNIVAHSRRIWTATNSKSEHPLWFSHVLTTSDPARATSPLHRRRALRRILKQMSIPQPAGTTVNTLSEINTFRRNHHSAVSLLALRGRSSAQVVRIEPSDDLQENEQQISLPCFIQVRGHGTRLRVIATRTKTLAMITAADDAHIDPTQLHAADSLAVRSIKAVPQLRWAVVEILISGSQYDEVAQVVENMTTQSIFNESDVLIAGSMADVYTMLVRGASPPVDH